MDNNGVQYALTHSANAYVYMWRAAEYWREFRKVIFLVAAKAMQLTTNLSTMLPTSKVNS